MHSRPNLIWKRRGSEWREEGGEVFLKGQRTDLMYFEKLNYVDVIEPLFHLSLLSLTNPPYLLVPGNLGKNK